MNNFCKARSVPLFGLIALVAIIGFAMTACDNNPEADPSPKTETFVGTANGSTYTLVITDESTFELTVTTGGTTKKSSGTAVKTATGWTLTPSTTGAESFSVATGSGGISGFTGTITFTDGSEPEEAPATVTPQAPSTGGTFTLTGIPASYNGEYAMFWAYVGGGADTADSALVGVQSLNMETQAFNLVQISNGTVSLPMWRITQEGGNPARYSGNDTVDGWVMIYDKQTITNEDEICEYNFTSITFNNGGASRSVNDAVAEQEAEDDQNYKTVIITGLGNAISNAQSVVIQVFEIENYTGFSDFGGDTMVADGGIDIEYVKNGDATITLFAREDQSSGSSGWNEAGSYYVIFAIVAISGNAYYFYTEDGTNPSSLAFQKEYKNIIAFNKFKLAQQ